MEGGQVSLFDTPLHGSGGGGGQQQTARTKKAAH